MEPYVMSGCSLKQQINYLTNDHVKEILISSTMKQFLI